MYSDIKYVSKGLEISYKNECVISKQIKHCKKNTTLCLFFFEIIKLGLRQRFCIRNINCELKNFNTYIQTVQKNVIAAQVCWRLKRTY